MGDAQFSTAFLWHGLHEDSLAVSVPGHKPTFVTQVGDSTCAGELCYWERELQMQARYGKLVYRVAYDKGFLSDYTDQNKVKKVSYSTCWVNAVSSFLPKCNVITPVHE